MRSLSEYIITGQDQLPKYELAKRAIMQYIADLPEDVDCLPYEYEMEEQLKVGRRSVRRALEELRKVGMIKTVRNRGSLILSRTPSSHPEVNDVVLNGLRVGMVFYSDQDVHGPTGYLPWQVSDEFEKRLNNEGGYVTLYNLRQLKWEPKTLLDSLRWQKINWIVICKHEKFTDDFFELMAAAGIKVVTVENDISYLAYCSRPLYSGIDFVSVNHERHIYSVLCSHYEDSDLLVYCQLLDDAFWVNARADVIKRFANERGIGFIYQRADVKKPSDFPSHDEYLDYYKEIGSECIAPVADELTQYSRPLVIAGNDHVARGVMDYLHEHGLKVPEQVRVIGYDNIVNLRYLNLTTSDFNSPAIADALFSLLKEYLVDPESHRAVSSGRIVMPVFIKRNTA